MRNGVLDRYHYGAVRLHHLLAVRVYMSSIFRLLIVALAFLTAPVFAAFPPTLMYESQSHTTGKMIGPASASSICAQQLSDLNSASAGSSYSYSAAPKDPPGACDLRRSDGAVIFVGYYGGAASCPVNSSLVGGSCVCNSTHVEQGGQCISKQDPNHRCATDFNMSGFGIGQGLGTVRDTKVVSGIVPSGEMCWPHDSPTSGCTVIFTRSSLTTLPDGSFQSGGSFSMYGGAGGSGKACSVPPKEAPPTEVSEKCDKPGSYTDSKGTHSLCFDAPKCEGGFGGEVNGVEVCVRDKGGNIIETEKIGETKNPDGSKDTVKEVTTCKGSTCTTVKTTTSTQSNGTPGASSSTSKTESKEDFCKGNAGSSQCKDDEEKEGSFGGSCEGGFTCEGDALQCAQTKEQHKRNCEMLGKDTDANSLTNKALNGTDTQSADALKASAGQINVGTSFDQAGLGWSHSCPPDPRIALNFGGRGSEFSIPFSRICGPLGILSLAGVGITLLGCCVWVLGSKKGA